VCAGRDDNLRMDYTAIGDTTNLAAPDQDGSGLGVLPTA
jgi:hypothetical protein